MSCPAIRSCRLQQSGMILIEVLVAALIFAVGILAVIGLQATAVGQVADAKYRLDASLIANQRIGQMWVDQGNLANYVCTETSLAQLPNGTLTISLANGNEVTVRVGWRPPHDNVSHSYTQVAVINASGT